MPSKNKSSPSTPVSPASQASRGLFGLFPKKGKFWDFAPFGTKNLLSVFAYRFNPETMTEPAVDEYQVDRDAFGPMALDALMYIKKEVDPTLTFRRSCREGVCGSCAMNVNGTNTLACTAPIGIQKKITFYPLPHQSVIKDLVPDLSHALKQYASLKPWIQHKKPLKPEEETRQSPEAQEQLNGLWECVLCFCCSTSCPSYWWNSDHYLGPATLLQAARWIEDSRDNATDTRLENVEGPFSLYRCHTILNCTKACPKGLNPAKAINGLKRKLAHKTN